MAHGVARLAVCVFEGSAVSPCYPSISGEGIYRAAPEALDRLGPGPQESSKWLERHCPDYPILTGCASASVYISD